MRKTITVNEFVSDAYEFYDGKVWYQDRSVAWIEPYRRSTVGLNWNGVRIFALVLDDANHTRIRVDRAALLEIEAQEE